MPSKNHSHRYRKKIYPSGNSVFFCTLPDCTHKIECEFTLGKLSICNLCGNEFTMNEYQIKLVKPHCEDCSKVKIRGADGQNHYIRRSAITSISDAGSTGSLRDRLQTATISEADKDI